MQHRRRRSLVWGSVATAVLALGISASVALGANFGSNTTSESWPAHICDGTDKSQCVADGTFHAVYIYSGLGDKAAAIRSAISYYAANTDSAVAEYPLFSDVNVQAGAFPSIKALAWTQCSSAATYGGADPNRWCKPQQLIWNTSFESSHFSTLAKKEYIACHELGHTVGLRHTSRTATCMRVATIEPNVVPGTDVLDTHDKAEVNAQYN